MFFKKIPPRAISEYSEILKSLSPDKDFIGNKLYSELLDAIKVTKSNISLLKNKIKEIGVHAFQKDMNEINSFFDSLNKETVQLSVGKFTKAELIKRWIELQDKHLLPTFRRTMNYNQDSIGEIEKCLTRDEIEFAKGLLDQLLKPYLKGELTGNKLNDFTREYFYLNYTDYFEDNNYSPVKLIGVNDFNDKYYSNYDNWEQDEEEEEEIDSNDKQDQVESDLNDLIPASLSEIYYRNIIYSEDKEVVIKKPISKENIFLALENWISDIENTVNLYPAKLNFLSVFDDDKLLKTIRKHHGKTKYKELKNLCNNLYDYNC